MSWMNEVHKIEDGLYCILDVQSVNKYLIVGRDRALLFDTGFGFEPLEPILQGITDKPVVAVDSHADPDHCLGNYLFDEVYLSRHDYRNLGVNDQPATKRGQLDYRLQKRGSKLADEMGDQDAWMAHSVYEPRYRLIDEGFVFDLGGLALEVVALPGHTSGSIALYQPERGWLFTGDSVMDHNVYYVALGDPPRGPDPMMVYYDSMCRLQRRKRDFTVLFPGHGPYGISPAAIDDAVENLRQIHAGAGEERPVDIAFGLTATQHRHGTSLIYYADAYVREFRAGRLVH